MANEIENCAILPLIEATPSNPVLALNGELYLNSSYSSIFYKDINGAVHEVSGSGSVNPTDYQLKSEKNVDSGYVGLTNVGRLAFKNITDGISDNILSYLQNNNTGTRYYTFPDKTGTVALISDVTAIDPSTYQLKSEKSQINGYVGLSSNLRIVFKNKSDSVNPNIVNYIAADSTVARTYTFPDISGTIAVNGAVDGVVPVGGIIMWSGTISTIPLNWRLCNGQNGTPDLRDRFIVGASQDEGGIAKTNITTDLTISGGSKDAIVVSHTHGYDKPTYLGTAETPAPAGAVSRATDSATTDSAGESGVNKNLPPYYALAFIMRIV